MAYVVTEDKVIPQAIADTSSTKLVPLGTRIKAVDSTYGEGEFIYLAGVASTAIGDLVIFDQYAGTTTRAVAGSRGPAAVATSANVASSYGWYQIAGAAVVKAGTVAANGNVYLTSTAGTVDDATVSGDKVDGARFKTADGTPSAGYAIAQISRPSLNGNG